MLIFVPLASLAPASGGASLEISLKCIDYEGTRCKILSFGVVCSVHVYVYVCVCVYLGASVCVCVSLCDCVCAYVFVCVCVCMSVCVCVCVTVDAHPPVESSYECAQTTPTYFFQN